MINFRFFSFKETLFIEKIKNIVVEKSGLSRLVWDQEATKVHTWVRIPPTIRKTVRVA